MAAIAFDEFWKTYPLRKGKESAVNVWRRLSGKDRRAAIAGISAYVGDCCATGVAMAYPAKYLTGRRWEDERTADMRVAPIVAPACDEQEGMEEW